MKTRTPKSVRIAALVFPPAGMVLLLASRQIRWPAKIFGVFWIGFYALCYTLVILALLVQTRWLHIEWLGGPVPSLVRERTLPNYDRLDAHRAAQAGAAGSPARTGAGTDLWPGFRGPHRDGHYTASPIRTNWPAAGLPLKWRQPVGGGYASFAIADGVAFTLEQRRKEEAITAYDLETGRELWSHPYYSLFEESLGGDGPRATPLFHQGYVYSLGAIGILKCLNATNGRALWSTNILIDNDTKVLAYGMAGSPLVVDDRVIVTPGGPHGGSVAAYHRLTSYPVWKSLDDGQAYSSPMVVTLAGERQVLIVGEVRAVGLAVDDGRLLWEYPWQVQQGNRNIAQPLVLGPDRFLLSAGYGTGCAAVQVVKSANGFTTRTLWRNKNLKNKFTSSVLHEGHIYGLDEDILACLEAATGERKWKDGRYGYGQLLLAQGHLIILGGDGSLALVRAAPDQHQELARFPALRGKTWNHPALVPGRLLVRNSAEMACFDITP